MSSDSVPPQVIELLKKTDIGYLSVTSPKGDLYTYPIAFCFTGQNIYFVTPISSAKLKFIKANPKVSLIVDNKQLTKDACGAMIQGEAMIFSVKQTLRSILSVIPTTVEFSKKYPGMFTFYAKGKELPDERKIYKYRLVRINPTKIVYWVGYNFGKYVPKKTSGRLSRLFPDLKGDQKREGRAAETMAKMFESLDEELSVEELFSVDDLWFNRLEEASLKGLISDEERRIIHLFVKSSFEGVTKITDTHGPKVSDEERELLKKWRKSDPKP
jgi:uncharacterized pyridoxamine 5'-phosphate oxidase family protein